MSHTQKINQIKEHLEKQNYICKKNSFPIFLPDENRFSFLDLACFKRGEKPRAFEIESKTSQMLRNKKGLEEFKRIFGGKICQIFADDSIEKCGF